MPSASPLNRAQAEDTTACAATASSPAPLLSIAEVYPILAGLLTPVVDTELVPLGAARDRVTAGDVSSGLDLPRFDNSAVDGFGMAAADLTPRPAPLTIVGAVRAGGTGMSLGAGQAIYLATGAPIPPGVAAVVMQEKVVASRSHVVLREPLKAGANIRRAGEDVQRGATIVPSGTPLDARHVGILAAAGRASVSVRRTLRIAILSTGDELRAAGESLAPNRIHDVNGPMLAGLIAGPGIDIIEQAIVADTLPALTSKLSALSPDADVIVTSGGAAGSDSDHVAAAIRASGGTAVPLRMALRPGKPIVLGRIGKALVLGLPGNPVAALVNFMLFGRPAIDASRGLPLAPPRGEAAVAGEDIVSAAGRTEFVPVVMSGVDGEGRPRLLPAGRGGSARLMPLVAADGFARLPEGSERVPAGAPLTYFPFRAAFRC